MDPVTHAAIGLAVSKITGNSFAMSDAATIGILIGSVIPDMDIMLQKWGDYVYLKNHRGITHSITGIIASSLLVASAVSLFSKMSFLSLFLWTLLGSFSHLFFDLFNSYGAKFLWPFSEKKFSFGMLVSFDPILILSLAGFVFLNNKPDYAAIAALPVYMLLKAGVRYWAKNRLKSRFAGKYDKINLLPATTRPFRWHLILHGRDCDVICEKKFFRNEISIIKTLEKSDEKGLQKAKLSETGKFFDEFTPIYNISCERIGEINRFVFSDLRYFVKNDFLHHAIVDVDKNNKVVKQTFNPYSINRSCSISG